jgi:hypothetical protein
MTDTFDDAWFDSVLQDVQATAPEDLRVAIMQMAGTDRPLHRAADAGRPRPRRLALAATLAAAVAIGVAGLVVFLGRGDAPSTVTTDSSPASGPATSAVAPNTSAAPNTSTAPTATVPLLPDSTAASTTAAPPSEPASSSDDTVLATLGLTAGTTLSGDEAAAALAALDDHRIERLRASTGFRGTSTFGRTWVLSDGSTPQADDPSTVVDVTVLASGDVWAEYPNGDWFRFDAAAGINRSLSTNPFDGSLLASQDEEAPVQHNYYRVFGHDPLQRLIETEQNIGPSEDLEIQVSASEFEGGEAVEVRFESERLGVRRFVVDLGTGLIVESEWMQFEEEGTLGGYSSISGLTDADVLPVSTVPQLPAGVEWQVFEYVKPMPTTIEAARAAFGAGLVLPVAALDAGMVAMEYSSTTADFEVVRADDPRGVSRSVMISYAESVGLLRTTIRLYTERPGPNGTVPDRFARVGDRLCFEPCRSTLSGPSSITPETGALAGVPFDSSYDGMATVVDGIHLSIVAPTTDEAMAMANTLVTVAGAD